MALKSCIVLSITLFLVSSQEQYFETSISDLCFAPPSSGPCKAYFPKFYYNPLTRACDCFVFGGCGGNANNFDTLDECAGNCSAGITHFVSPNCRVIFAGSTDDPLVVSPPPGAGVTLPPIDDDAPDVIISRFGPDRARPEDPVVETKRNASTLLYPLPPTYVHAHPPYGLHNHHYYYPYATPILHSNFIYAPPRSPYFLPYWLPYHHPTFRTYTNKEDA